MYAALHCDYASLLARGPRLAGSEREIASHVDQQQLRSKLDACLLAWQHLLQSTLRYVASPCSLAKQRFAIL